MTLSTPSRWFVRFRFPQASSIARGACARIAIVAVALAVTQTVSAADISWTGMESDDWNTGMNWSPQCSGMFCAHFVPDNDDDVTISGNLITGTNVELSANAEVNSLFIGDGFRVTTNGHQLDAGGGHGALGPLLQLDGIGTVLEVHPFGGPGRSLVTNRFHISNNAAMELHGGSVEVTHAGESTIEFLTQLRGHGLLIFDNFPGTPGSVLDNRGSICVEDGDLTISAGAGGTLDLDGFNGNGRLDVDDETSASPGNRTLTINAPLADAFDGVILVGRGDRLHFQNNWLFGNAAGSAGSLNLNGHAGTATLSGGTLSVVSDAVAATIRVNSGVGRIESDLNMPTGVLDVADDTTIVFAGDATLGAGMQFDVGSGYDLVIEGSTTINTTFDWDSFAPANHLTTITQTGFLTINATQIDTGDNKFDGSLLLEGGNLSIQTPTPWIHNGRIDLDNNGAIPDIFGSQLIVGDGFDNGLDALIDVGGTDQSRIIASSVFRSDAEVQIAAGARLRLLGNSQIDSGAEFSGDGELVVDAAMDARDGANIGVHINNRGEFAVGVTFIADVTVASFEQSVNGELEVEMSTPAHHDQLFVTGDIALAGTLDGQTNAAVPSRGDQFDIIHAASVTGEFDTFALPPLPAGDAWKVIYNPTSVILEIVAALMADFDDDGDVDGDDFLTWQSSFGMNNGGDADGDGDTDGDDFLIWQGEFGSGGVVSSNAAPEPGAVWLTIFLVTCFFIARRNF